MAYAIGTKYELALAREGFLCVYQAQTEGQGGPMPRFLVYINTHPEKRHVTVHPETKKGCGSVVQQVHSSGPYSTESDTERLDYDTLKIATTDNSYWLLVWGADILGVYQNKHVLAAAAEVGCSIQTCDHCR
jgi:hypothetical protein